MIDINKIGSNVILRRILFTFSILFCMTGFIYLFSKALNPKIGYIDFRYIWTAGKLWGDKINPYSEGFSLFARNFISENTNITNWCYPPTWFFISWPLSLFELNTSVAIWKILNVIFLYTGVFILCKSYSQKQNILFYISFFLCIGYVSFMQASAIAISIGQTSPLIFLGISFLIYGGKRDKNIAMIVGLVLIALKPQIGFYFFIIFLLHRKYWKVSVFAIGISLILIIPSILAIGLEHTIIDFLKNLMSYNNLEVNSVIELSGISNLFYFIVPQAIIPTKLSILLGFIVLLLVLYISKKERQADNNYRLALTLIVVLLFIPLHSYDYLIALGLISYLLHVRNLSIQFFSIIILIFLLRIENIADFTGIKHEGVLYSPGSFLSSIFFCLLSIFYLVKEKKNYSTTVYEDKG